MSALPLVENLLKLVDKDSTSNQPLKKEEKKESLPDFDHKYLNKDNFPPLKNDAVLKAAFGKSPHRIPIWIHRQAGRYMKEFRDMRSKFDFFTICRTPALACEVTLQPINAFDLDAAIIFSDILVIPPALGLEVKMVPGKGPIFPNPLRLPKDHDLSRLNTNVNIQQKLQYVYDGITLTRHKLEGRVPLIGFVGGPFTLMAYSIEGESSKLYRRPKQWLYTQPELSRTLLRIYTDAIIQHCIGQCNAGAQMLEIFESSAGYLSPRLFRKFILPCLKRIYDTVRKQIDSNIPIIMFARDAHFMLKDLTAIGFEVVALDWGFDPTVARQTVPQITFQGNLDPWVLFSNSDNEIEEEVCDMLQRFGMGTQGNNGSYDRKQLIVNLGHGMMPGMRPSAVTAFINAVRKFDSQFCS